LLSHWGAAIAPSGKLDVSWLVKRQTLRQTARAGRAGLTAGQVAPGYKADLNVIDFR